MSAVVTVMNMKGGVGKTTISVNLAGILSRYFLGGKPLRVLAIDYDPQFNLSQAFLPPKKYFSLEKDEKTTLSVLVESTKNLDPYKLQVPGNHTPPRVKDIVENVFNAVGGGRLDILASTLDLMYVALGQANANTHPIEERFHKFIDDCRNNYDLTIIDCHPAGSLFTKTSLQNSDYVIIPVVPQKYAVRGIGLMLEFIRAKKAGAKSPTPLILFNATPRTGVTQQEATIRADKAYAAFCLAPTLKRYKAFGEPEAGSGFVWESNKPYSTSAFQNLVTVAREIRAKVGLL